MEHMMIDLETLDTRASAVIVSVGAVVFNKEGILREGYYVLDMDEQIKRGRTISPDTVRWWMQQSDEARAVFRVQQPMLLSPFALAFTNLFQMGKMHLWGNGSDFDLAIMIDFWQRHSLPKIDGWRYSNHMCFRTLNKMYNAKDLGMRTGTHHNAVDDARYQANCVIAAWKKFDLKL